MTGWKIKTRRGRLDLDRTRVVWSRFRRYTRAQAWVLLGAFGASVCVVATQLAAPWPIKVIFDHVLSRHEGMAGSWMARLLDRVAETPLTALAWVCGAVLVIAIADGLCSYARDVLLARAGQAVTARLRHELFAHLQTLSPTELQRRHTGELLTRLTGDMQMLRQMLVDVIIILGESGLLVVATVVAMLWLNWSLALLGLCTIPLTAFASWRISRQITKATDAQRERESEIASIAQDVLGAMTVIQAYNREPIEQKRFARQNRSSLRAGLKTTRLESKLYRIVTLAGAVAMCAILFVGVRDVLSKSMTAGDLLVFVSYLRMVSKPMRRVAKVAGQVAKATSCGSRIAELLATETSIKDRSDAVELSGVRGEIAFDRVSFTYSDRDQAVADVSLTIRPGERVALVGHTGAGKTTLMKLLLRFYDPTAGAVRIDGTDLRDVTLASLRRCIGWVQQDTILFGMTVAENVALGRPEADTEAIYEAARAVRADEFVERLPDGYDTVLGQGGCDLSGGQRQRIALARALLRDPAVLLLDEPATGLDEATRRQVEQAWLSPNNKATTIVICHQLIDMERFDSIVVMGRGQVVGLGPHALLLGTCEEYADLLAAGSDGRAVAPRLEASAS